MSHVDEAAKKAGALAQSAEIKRLLTITGTRLAGAGLMALGVNDGSLGEMAAGAGLLAAAGPLSRIASIGDQTQSEVYKNNVTQNDQIHSLGTMAAPPATGAVPQDAKKPSVG